MNKSKELSKEIIKKVTEKTKERFSKVKPLRKKIKLFTFAAAVGIVVVTGGVYALGSEEREAVKILEQKKAAELQLEKDKAKALVEEAKVLQEAIDNADKAKDIIVAKGEYSPITAEAERRPEISISDKGGFSSWWGKNVLRVFIPYEIKYMIDMQKITPIVSSDGLLFEFGEDDFNVIVVPKSYAIMTPDSEEVGLFPKSFTNEEVLALVSSNAKVTAEEFSKNEENLTKAVEETKKMIEGIADSCNAKVTFLDKKSKNGASVKIDESSIVKGDN